MERHFEPEVNDNQKTLEVLLGKGRLILDGIFRNRYKIVTGKDWICSTGCAREFVNSIGRHLYKQAGKRERQKIMSGDINQWDITLLKKAIEALAEETTRLTGDCWEEELRKIKDLANVRNDVAHSTTNDFKGRKFRRLYDNIKETLVALGDNEETIETYRKTVEDKNIVNILDWTTKAIRICECSSPLHLLYLLRTFGPSTVRGLVQASISFYVYVVQCLYEYLLLHEKITFLMKFYTVVWLLGEWILQWSILQTLVILLMLDILVRQPRMRKHSASSSKTFLEDFIDDFLIVLTLWKFIHKVFTASFDVEESSLDTGDQYAYICGLDCCYPEEEIFYRNISGT